MIINIDDKTFAAAIVEQNAGQSAREAREQAERVAMGAPGLDWAKNIANATIGKLAGDLTLAFGNEFLVACAIIRKHEADFYERIRVRLKQKGATRLSEFDGQVRARQHAADQQERDEHKQQQAAQGRATRPGSGQALVLDGPEPWDQPVDGALLVEDIAATIRRFVFVDKSAIHAITLWIVFSYLVEDFNIAPRLDINSPVMRCGKSTLVELLKWLARRTLACSNISPAAVFRTIDLAKPTLLVDEFDSFGGLSEELRNILNSGHKRSSAFVIRVVGDDLEPRKFSTFAAIATAMIGRLPATLYDRSIQIHMRRKLRAEKVERLDEPRKRNFEQLQELARRIARWTQDNRDRITQTVSAIPGALDSREVDNWRPLLAIADVVGSGWPELARTAAVELSGADAAADETLGVLLLGDLRDLFEAVKPWTVVAEGKGQTKDVKRLSSVAICKSLHEMEERPWPEYGRAHKPISQAQLARLLRPFGITPGSVGLQDGTTPKGYDLKDFADAFSRYLPYNAYPTRQSAKPPGGVGGNADFQGAKGPTFGGSENELNAHADKGSGGLADENAGNGQAAENTRTSDGKKEGF
jgi:putative DNA primase/helicase